MDLIYMNSAKEDVGVLLDYTFDLAYGCDENDFECKIITNNHCCDKGFYLYFENTEYGGIIDNIGVDTESEEITYSGRTWHGILNSKIIEPDSGQDYLIVSGEANEILSALITRLDLSDLFTVSSEDSGISITSYQMNRYIGGYDGVRKMLQSVNGKLTLSFKNGAVELSAKPLVDYSQDEQFDSDQIAFKLKKKGNITNHMICLGKGDLKEREVIHLYTDKQGNLSDTKIITGVDEVCELYENTNATSDELKQGGIERLQEDWNSDELEYSFDSDKESFDIGDIVGTKEWVTDTEISSEITKKIITISNGVTTVSYKVGEQT